MVGRFLSTAFLFFDLNNAAGPQIFTSAALRRLFLERNGSLLTYLILILKIAFLMVVGSPTFTAVR